MEQGYNLRNRSVSKRSFEIVEDRPDPNSEKAGQSAERPSETPSETGPVSPQPLLPLVSQQQLRSLYNYFELNQSPNSADCELIAKRLAMRPDHVAKWFSRERLKRHRLLKEDQLQRSSSLDKRADFFLRMQKRRLAAQQRAGALFFGQRRNFQNHPARPGSMFNQNAARHNPWALNHNSMRAQPAQRGFAPFQAANGALEPLEHQLEEPVFRHRFRPAPFPGLSRNPFSAPNFDRRTRGPLLRPYFGYSHFAFGGRGRGKKRRAAPRARFESSLPPPPALPKPRAMVEMIKEAISELNESKNKTNKINIKTWIKEHYDTSFYKNFQENFNKGLRLGTERSLFYEFSNTFRLTSSLVLEHQNANVYSEEEVEASCPIPDPIPESSGARKEALRGFVMGEILAQEPHFSLQKKDIFRRIETMTPEKFKNWALYESVKKENATKDKIKNCDNDDTIKDGEEDKIKDGEKDKIKDGEKDKIKDEEDKDDDKNVDKKIKNDYKKIKNDDRNGAKDESFSKEDNEDDESDSENSKKAAIPPRRSLRKTPTRLLKAQMELLNKRKSAFLYESGKRRMPCFADEVLEELVSSRRLAVWLKQKEKRNGGKKRVYFATKKSIQWKSLSKSRLRIAPFSRRSKEEDEFFEIKDKNNMSPQEEQKLREQMNKKVSDQIQFYSTKRAEFFIKHANIFSQFVSKRYMSSAKALLRKNKSPKPKTPPKQPLKRQPKQIRGKLRSYQMEGLNWLINLYENGLCGILGDEMGLGKTLQTIAFVAHLKTLKAVGPVLVVCPLNVLTNWCNEFARWAPTLEVVRFHGPERELNRVLRDRLDIGTFDVLVTTFEMVRAAENVVVNRFHYQCVVVDEAHRVKNDSAQISESLRGVTGFFKILLTGTPLQNNLRELWSLLNFLYPEQFESAHSFDRGFNLIGNKVNEDTMWQSQKVLKLFMLRRFKVDVANLPPKLETKVLVPMTECQVFWYKRLLAYQSQQLVSDDKKTTGSMKKLIALITQLRKCCNHPFLFPNCDPGVNDPGYGERIITSSGKLLVLDKMLKRLKENGHRVLIFSQYTSVLDILQDYCRYRNWIHLRLDGSTNRVQRQFDISRFNKKNSKIFIYLITTRAGGLGVNLHTADTVIIYDSDWNPQADLQAQDRAHRIGQTKTVRVFGLITEGSIEERIAQRAEKKLYLDAVVASKTGARRKSRRPPTEKDKGKRELLAMLTFGAERVFSTEGRSVSDEDVDLLLGIRKKDARSRSRLEPSAANAAEYDVRAGPLAITQFRGEKVASLRCAGQNPVERIAVEWAEFNNRLPPLDAATAEDGRELEFVDVKYKRFYGHEATCHACKQEGLLLLCEWCPRSYHHECLGYDAVPEGSFKCPQHKCDACFRSAHEAGGMLFRCVNCPHCSCEDHLSFDIAPVDRCEELEAFGYKRSSSAFYVLCSKRCEKAATERRKRRATEEESASSAKKWEFLPQSVKNRIRMALESDEVCSLSELPGFVTKLKDIDPQSPLLQRLHEVLYNCAPSQIFYRINGWRGVSARNGKNEGKDSEDFAGDSKTGKRRIGEEEKEKAAELYNRATAEFSSWRQPVLLRFCKMLGIWTKSEPKRICGGASSGRVTNPKDRSVSAVDSEDGLVCHLSIFLVRPAVHRLYARHKFLDKSFDFDDPTEIEEVRVERKRKVEEIDENSVVFEKAEIESLDFSESSSDREPAKREVVLLRKNNPKNFTFIGVVERSRPQLRKRKKRRRIWEPDSFDGDDYESFVND